MSYTNGLDKPSDYFSTKLYTGTGSSHAVSGIGFQPDWVWIKCRDDSHNHQVFDSVRGVHKRMRTDTNGAETTSSESLKSFDTGGYTLGTQANVNNPSNTFVSWNWLASNSTASNTDGSITSTVSANTTSGFSIVSYAGSSSNITVGHGLGVTPKMIIFKNRTSSSSWTVYHESLGNGHRLVLNNDNAKESTNQFSFGTSPTSSVFALGGGYGDVNTSGANYIAYCFAEKKGFSKFGSYTGNGNADGTFIYTGFKPAWVMVKNTVNNARNWTIIDNKRNPFNPEDEWLYANASDSTFDASSFPTDFVSNGFKIRNTGSYFNTSGENYIYMAFAESSFLTSTGIPTCAR